MDGDASGALQMCACCARLHLALSPPPLCCPTEEVQALPVGASASAGVVGASAGVVAGASAEEDNAARQAC
eukprot:6491619-Amphidinium_carterae.2